MVIRLSALLSAIHQPNSQPYAPASWQEQASGQTAGGGGEGESGGGAGAGAAVNPSVPLSQIQFQNVFIPETYDGSGYANQFVVQPVIAINRKPESFFPYHIIRATFPVLAPVADPDGIAPDLPGLGDSAFGILVEQQTKHRSTRVGCGCRGLHDGVSVLGPTYIDLGAGSGVAPQPRRASGGLV